MNKVSKEIRTWQLYELDKPLLTTSYFGFMPIETPRIKNEDFEATHDCEPHPHYSAAEKAAFLRAYTERNLGSMQHPLAVSYRADGGARNTSRYALELVGFTAGIAEALLVRASLSILLENGYKHLVVDVNCIGDRESMSAYEQELHNFLRRTEAGISPELKKELRKDIFSLVRVPLPETEALRQNMPSSIAFLSPQARTYFKEVLEHIESLGIEFRLNPELVGHRSFCSHTIFAIKNIATEEETLAVGYCYPRLSRRFKLKKEVSLSGASLFLPRETNASQQRVSGKSYKGLRPKFHLIQLGREAKMKSLSVIELLRKEHIAIYHVLGKDKVTAQLSSAESLASPYLIIIGHKEALDNTAIIRNTSTRAQDVVTLEDLPRFLKNLPI